METKSTEIEIKSSNRLLTFFQLKNWVRVQTPRSSKEGMFWSGSNSPVQHRHWDSKENIWEGTLFKKINVNNVQIMSEFLLTSVDINKNMGLVLCFFKYLIISAGFRTMLAGVIWWLKIWNIVNETRRIIVV